MRSWARRNDDLDLYNTINEDIQYWKKVLRG